MAARRLEGLARGFRYRLSLNAIMAEWQTAFASSSMSCSEVSAAASRFAFRMAGNPNSSIGTMSRPGACGRSYFTSEQALEQARAFARVEREDGNET